MTSTASPWSFWRPLRPFRDWASQRQASASLDLAASLVVLQRPNAHAQSSGFPAYPSAHPSGTPSTVSPGQPLPAHIPGLNATDQRPTVFIN